LKNGKNQRQIEFHAFRSVEQAKITPQSKILTIGSEWYDLQINIFFCKRNIF